jgi:hypothetical protein
MMHGLTFQLMANEPDMPVGSGRYDGLIEAAVALFDAAWGTGTPSHASADSRARETSGGNAKEVDGWRTT